MTIWTPTLSGRGPLYRQLLEALRSAIQNGELSAGSRLPTHRALADRLGVTVGTITRAYHEAEQCGLITARVGSGSYVRDAEQSSSHVWHLRQEKPGRIELWQNLPVALDRSAAFRDAILALSQESDCINGLMEYDSADGNFEQRHCFADWLQRHEIDASAERLFFNYGAQNGLLLAVMMLGLSGQALLCEGLTYPGLMTLAQTLKLQLRGLPMDAEGIIPDALDKACQDGLFRAIYLIPTLQNPTTAVMSTARREAILAICARHQLWVIEDDVHGLLPADRPPAMVNLAPERVIYLGSFSKGTSAGLRIGYMLVPLSLHTAAQQAIRATSWMVSPLLIELACRWMQGGEADALLRQQRQQLAQRAERLQYHLGHFALRYAPGSMHAWLELPEQWRAASFIAAAEAEGIGLAGAELFAAGHFNAPQAVRLSISHPLDMASLEQALTTLASLLESSGPQASLL
ncbi:PLP-dependent aminotransferase family protein [Pseudaeromonas sharmana]|uniref:PLP-dependent aminotransferase family protein n=1 Tax=Pseudaeromonas sharmana TaxID=328412 RepID=A0ABV8CRN0_9GAMM